MLPVRKRANAASTSPLSVERANPANFLSTAALPTDDRDDTRPNGSSSSANGNGSSSPSTAFPGRRKRRRRGMTTVFQWPRKVRQWATNNAVLVSPIAQCMIVLLLVGVILGLAASTKSILLDDGQSNNLLRWGERNLSTQQQEKMRAVPLTVKNTSSTGKMQTIQTQHYPWSRNNHKVLMYPHTNLTRLSDNDYQQFTVRINTWERPEQLRLSIEHYMSCGNSVVAQIQVVWCIAQGEVPSWLTDIEQNRANSVPLVVERHSVNSLNVRFDVQSTTLTPTLGILSTDDDVLRPCLALQAAFVEWTRNPDRQVGFDARSHGITSSDHATPTTSLPPPLQKRWTYAYMSTTERTNLYSLTLTRHSFQHVDYLHSYTRRMPASMRDKVARHMNCEDIAMSFWISSLTQGQPPLLADAWAVKSQIKLYVESKISGGQSHKQIRDECVDEFAELLQLKQRLVGTPLRHHDNAYFAYGAAPTDWNAEAAAKAVMTWANKSWYNELQDTLARWKAPQSKEWMAELADLRRIAAKPAYDQGMIEQTSPWKKRFHSAKRDHKSATFV